MFNKKMHFQHSRAEPASKQQSSTSTLTLRTRYAVLKVPHSTEPICFFCNKPAGTAELHHADATEITWNVCRSPTELVDTEHIAKLSEVDVVAIGENIIATVFVHYTRKSDLPLPRMWMQIVCMA